MPTLAFCGAGHIAEVHALAAARAGMSIGPVASRTAARAAAFVAACGGTAVTFDDLPGGADLTIVATPPARHALDAIRSLQAGVPVLVEKPLATTLHDADRIVEATAIAGVPVGYAENLAFAPLVRQALALARTLRPLRHIEARLLSPPPDWGEFLDPGWGGGALFDSGAHPVALVLLAAAPLRPGAVRARLEPTPGGATDLGGEIELDFPGGLRAHVVASWSHDERVRDLQVAGDDGVVRAELLPEPRLERNGEPLVLPSTATDPVAVRVEQMGFAAQLHWAAAVLPRVGPAGGPDAAVGRDVLEVLCAAYTSAGRGGADVLLPFRGDRSRTPLELWRTGG